MPEFKGKRVLVVEDEAMLAMDLCFTLRDLGVAIAGPCLSVRDAIDHASASTITAAILDVDLHGQPVFPVADLLSRRGVPFLFHTGRSDLRSLIGRYHAPICEKPLPTATIICRLRALIG